MRLPDWFGTCPPHARVWPTARYYPEVLVEIIEDNSAYYVVNAVFPLDRERAHCTVARNLLYPLTDRGPLGIGRYVTSTEFSGIGVVIDVDINEDDDAARFYVVWGRKSEECRDCWMFSRHIRPFVQPIIRSRHRRIITIRRH